MSSRLQRNKEVYQQEVQARAVQLGVDLMQRKRRVVKKGCGYEGEWKMQGKCLSQQPTCARALCLRSLHFVYTLANPCTYPKQSPTFMARLAQYWGRPRGWGTPMEALRVTKHCEGMPRWLSLARFTSL